MLRDRGNIKWSMSMMLPEHVEALREWMAEDDYIKRPNLSEWDMIELQEEIDLALRRRCDTEVQTWRNGEVKRHVGVIEDADVAGKRIKLSEGWIEIGEIIAVKTLE